MRSPGVPSQTVYPAKEHARKTWEYVASAPLWGALAPAILVLKGAGAATAFFYAHSTGNVIYNALVSADGTRVISPFVVTPIGLGIQYRKNGWITSHSVTKFSGSYGWLDASSLHASITGVTIGPDLFDAGVSADYFLLPNESFYGTGNNTSSGRHTLFAIRSIGAELPLSRRIGSWGSVSLTPSMAQYRQSHAHGDDHPPILTFFSPQDVPGVSSRAVLGGVRGSIAIDRRDNSNRPVKGILGEAGSGIFDEMRFDDINDDLARPLFGFALAEGDVQGFIPLPWGPYRVLVLHSELQIQRQLPGMAIPFYLQSRLGSLETARGIQRGRYTDRDRLVLSGEYRFPIWIIDRASMDASLFFDAGQVAHTMFADFGFGHFHPAGGFGIHLYAGEKSIAAISVGFSGSGVQAYFTLR